MPRRRISLQAAVRAAEKLRGIELRPLILDSLHIWPKYRFRHLSVEEAIKLPRNQIMLRTRDYIPPEERERPD
jgi:hypothetical protein